MTTYFRKLFSLISSPNKWTFIILPVIFVFCFIVSTVVSAKVSTGTGVFEDALGSPNYNKESFDLQTSYGLVSSLNVMIGGCQKETCPEETKKGVLNGLGDMVLAMYSRPPASGAAYAINVIENFGVAQPAYAQTTGTGFNALAPLLPLWRGFRNFSYILFVLVFVLMGLGVMFRMKLNPQTVVTIQSALPRIVIALLLVTFSYAIAGFVVDLIYVLIALMALMFGQVNGIDGTALQQAYSNGGGMRLLGEIINAVPLKALSLGLIALLGGFAYAGVFTPFLGLFGTIVGAIAGIGAALLTLIILGIILYVFFRLFTQLLMAYIGIILAVVFAPIQITFGVIPGLQQMGFGAWFRNLFANAMVFPAVAFMLMFARVLKDTLTVGAAIPFWDPPLLAGGGALAGFIPALVGFGVLLILPQIPTTVKKAIGATDLQFGFGQAWKEAAGELAEEGAQGAFVVGRYRGGSYVAQQAAKLGTKGYPAKRFGFDQKAWNAFHAFGAGRKWWNP